MGTAQRTWSGRRRHYPPAARAECAPTHTRPAPAAGPRGQTYRNISEKVTCFFSPVSAMKKRRPVSSVGVGLRRPLCLLQGWVCGVLWGAWAPVWRVYYFMFPNRSPRPPAAGTPAFAQRERERVSPLSIIRGDGGQGSQLRGCRFFMPTPVDQVLLKRVRSPSRLSAVGSSTEPTPLPRPPPDGCPNVQPPIPGDAPRSSPHGDFHRNNFVKFPDSRSRLRDAYVRLRTSRLRDAYVRLRTSRRRAPTYVAPTCAYVRHAYVAPTCARLRT